MIPHLFLLPVPRQAVYTEGAFALPESRLILLDGPEPQALRPAAERVQRALGGLGRQWTQIAGSSLPAGQAGVSLRVAPQRAPVPQGYRLHIAQDGITIEGHDPAGVFYGACTLAQVLEQAGDETPCLEIVDWPDFPARGVMLDISRDRVYRMDYLYDLVDRLAGWKINQLQLYTEHTFAYPSHPLVWEKASPMMGEEILALDRYCRERFIELVPNQNSFGHMERWLRHAPYADLAETHDTFNTPWNTTMKGPFSLAPEHPGSIRLVSSMYDELLPNFTSRMFNVGCDETVDLGQGVSKAACEARGKGAVYFDFLMKVYADVKRRGYTMQFWGDIINNESPEMAALLPRDVIALAWGYEADHPFDVEGKRFADSGVPFYVCPGTSTWCSLAGRTDNALANLRSAAESGLKHGAIGYLNTDWGDMGHWQAPPVSYLGLAAGAVFSWALEANRTLDIPGAVSRFAFDDSSGAMGRLAYDLGNVYQAPGVHVPNGSALFWALQLPLEQVKGYDLKAGKLNETLEAIDAAMAWLGKAKMARADASIVAREFRNTARMMRHGARRAMLAVQGDASGLRKDLAEDMGETIAEYRALWLERCRPGGLADSAARLEKAAGDY